MGLKGVGKAACVGAGLSLAGVAAGLAFGSVAFGVGVGVAGLGLAFGTKTGRRMVGRAIKSSWREGARATWGKLGETALAGASIAGVAGASLGVAAAAVALGPVLAAGVVGVAGLGLAFGTKTGRKGLGVALGAVAKAASGLAASVRTGVQGIGQSLRKGGALKAAGVGASIAGAIGLAAAAPMIALGAGAVGLGAAALSKPGRNLISGMARGAGRSLSRITPKAWKGIMDKAKEHGVGRLTGLGMRAVLGEYNFGRYLKKAAELRGKKAWSGRTRATVGALAGRGIQKALGVTDKQMEALDRRAEGAMKLRNLEAVRNDVLDVMDGKKQVGDLTAEGKNALKEISGLGSGAIDNDLQTWVNSNKAAGTKATNEHFNKEADEIKKNYGTDEQISDQKNANRSLIEDAKTEQQQIEDARKEALNYTGKERIAGVKKAEELEAKNPSGIDESKAKTLAEYGIHTRGQLANINSEGMKDVKNAIIKAGISENDLDKLQKGAEKGCHRKTTKREQAMRDSGITEEDQMKDKRERDHRLRDELTRGGKKPEEKEDFLTAIEEERQQ
ncbi:MAG: hypothetical protein FJY77_04565 [Candidatus Altiarchaeales archaeon]|nr:hypothetical protein [Candidatus Altiarchaeales archaeon]